MAYVPIDDSFGGTLKRLRKSRSMTLRDLAAKSGTSRAYLSQLETGARKPPMPDLLKRIATGLDDDETARQATYTLLARLAKYNLADENPAPDATATQITQLLANDGTKATIKQVAALLSSDVTKAPFADLVATVSQDEVTAQDTQKAIASLMTLLDRS
ncbi:helix-turn-helix domain-containing protein [uncultured Lacticaseibacillus sp.]|uniref:helix-turn-helix domain-containing protein n=1 Tax=uncultured Lacticaseibacillus sp. TaxID=2775882 RepID=UPI002597DAA1|nr:helix-turn-helix transcriptional regulator [uncultured Lacticaseibacillus sp.]